MAHSQNRPDDTRLSESWRLAYDRAFRSLVWRTRPRHLQREVDALWQAAVKRPHDVTLAAACADVYREARQRVTDELRRKAARRWLDRLVNIVPETVDPAVPDFECDAALGGLARWLRGAGYDARWWKVVDDDELLRAAVDSGAVMLTTDRRLMDRGVITSGLVPACLVSVALNKRGQLLELAERLELPRRRPRCMACGGSLRAVDKQAVRERIPLRTYPWCDEYYVCERCGKLFWPGTHWQRISATLAELRPSELS